MSALRLRGLDAGYDGVPVVRGLDLEVEPGEIVALLGANGAGKTTTLMTIAGFLPSIGGTVSLFDEESGTCAPHELVRRGLGFVPEDRGVFPGLTVAENLRVGAPHGGAADVESVLGKFPALLGLTRRRAGLLSGGEQQMLGMARALIASPRLLLIDEMSLGLAPIVAARLLPVLRDLAREGTAIVLVEQHVELALRAADRGCVLRHGELVLAMSSAGLREDPELLRESYLGDSGT